MTDPLYVARARIEKVEGTHRRAHLEVGPSVEMGVHGAIKEYFQLSGQADLPLPVDYIVAATGA
ncbi:MAG TPA: hypothetical protein VFQ38_14375 [Longimicrobiales bacterium]|nr:hypothetical protein [Longimicrobiales bacterium]